MLISISGQRRDLPGTDNSKDQKAHQLRLKDQSLAICRSHHCSPPIVDFMHPLFECSSRAASLTRYIREMLESSTCSSLEPLAFERRLMNAYHSRHDTSHGSWTCEESILYSEGTEIPEDILYYHPSCREMSLSNEIGAIISTLHLGFSWKIGRAHV